jgi:hypothetical protein
MSISANPIALYCILASIGLGLAIGLTMAPLIVASWNYYMGCKTKYYR